MKTTINYKGFTIEITPDEFCNDSPNDWGNTDSFLVYDHRDFFVQRKGFDPDDIYSVMQEDKKTFEGYWFFPVYAYIHSGVALSLGRNSYPFNDRWDVSFKGFALVKREKTTWSVDKAYIRAGHTIDTWNDYLSGNVWNYMTLDKDGNTIDSCCGYYGDPEKSGCIEDAKSSIDYEIKKRNTEKVTKVKTWIKNHVPIEKRQELILAM